MFALGAAYAYIAAKVTRRLKPQLPSASAPTSTVASSVLQEAQA